MEDVFEILCPQCEQVWTSSFLSLSVRFFEVDLENMAMCGTELKIRSKIQFFPCVAKTSLDSGPAV
jgi:hypothetical protein